MNDHLKGKVAIVTGASSGIGRAVSRRLARDGAAVVVHYVGKRDAAESLVAEIRSAEGRAEAFRADLTEDGAVERLLEAATRSFGGLDIVILNAGAPLLAAPLTETEDAKFDSIFAINVRASFQLLKQGGKLLRNDGRVIGFSTPYVVQAQPDRAVIAASKAALQALVLGFSKEVGKRGITANVVIPGATDTRGFRDAVAAEVVPQIVGMTPLGRLGQPEDIADVVAFLCSHDARWITGQVLPVGGGLL